MLCYQVSPWPHCERCTRIEGFYFESHHRKSWCILTFSRRWPRHERLPHSPDAPIPTKGFWHIRCPPLEGETARSVPSLLCLMHSPSSSSSSSSSHRGAGVPVIQHVGGFFIMKIWIKKKRQIHFFSLFRFNEGIHGIIHVSGKNTDGQTHCYHRGF